MPSIADTQILDEILRREGGFVNHPADRGGATNYGITQKTLSEWLGREATIEDVEHITKDVARSIYSALYIEKPRLDAVRDLRLRALLVDCAVNHGPKRAVRWLQRALGVTADGVIGPRTLEALRDHEAPAELYRRVLAQRAVFYGRLITRDPSQAAFAHGWMKRLAEFIEAAP